MDTRTLDDTARLLLSGERGLLAMDEEHADVQPPLRRARHRANRRRCGAPTAT